MDHLLNVVIEVLQNDEEQGQASLEALIELSSTYPEVWKGCILKLITVCSEVMRNDKFEDAPR